MTHSALPKLVYFTNQPEFFKNLPKKQVSIQTLANCFKRPVWNGNYPRFALQTTNEVWLEQIFSSVASTLILYLDFSQKVEYRTVRSLLKSLSSSQLTLTVLIYVPQTSDIDCLPTALFDKLCCLKPGS